MRAAVYEEFGGADHIEVREVEDPPVGPDTVLVRARATSVNPVDWKVREGYLTGAFPHHLPIIPGWDVAGVVEAVGPAVVHVRALRQDRAATASGSGTVRVRSGVFAPRECG